MKTLLAHETDEIGNIPFVLKTVVLKRTNVHAENLGPFPATKSGRDGRLYLRLTVPKLVNEAFLEPQFYFESAMCPRRLNLLMLFFFYADGNQLKNFIDKITTVKWDQWRPQCRIWGKITASYEEGKSSAQMMGQFMEDIKKKFGQNAVKKLVFHDNCQDPDIVQPMRRGDNKMVQAMITCLDKRIAYAKVCYLKAQKQLDVLLDIDRQ